MKVRLDEIQPISQDVRTFWFVPDHMPQYVAGQFTELTVPHDNPDVRGVRHWFTLSSSPTEQRLSITTKFAHDRSSTYKQALSRAKPGDTFHMSEPMGDFVLPINRTTPLLFIAGGIGITPMRSMVKWLHDSNQQRHTQLIYAAEKPEDFAFQELFAVYDMPTTYMVRHPATDWKGEVGHIDATRILEAISGNPHTLIYISGPEPMTETLVKDLTARGIPGSRLVTDYFLGYPPV